MINEHNEHAQPGDHSGHGEPAETPPPPVSLVTPDLSGVPEHCRENPTTKKGTARKRSPKCSPAEKEKRIELVRALLRAGYSDWDIRRKLAPIWQVRRCAVTRYITWGRRANRSALELTEDQQLGASLDFWNTKKQESEKAIAMSNVAVQKAEADYRACDAEIVKLDGDPDAPGATERMEVLEMRRKSLLQRIKAANLSGWHARTESKEVQRDIDRILGTAAPRRILHGVAVAGSIQVEHTPLPVTLEENDREIEKLLGKLLGDGTVTVNTNKRPSCLSAVPTTIETTCTETPSMNGQTCSAVAAGWPKRVHQ